MKQGDARGAQAGWAAAVGLLKQTVRELPHKLDLRADRHMHIVVPAAAAARHR